MTVELSPLEDGQDDWPRLKELLDICAYKDTVCLEAGTWICQSKQRIPSGTHLVASPGVRIHQELVYTGTDFLNAAFSSGPIFGTPITATLSSPAAVGSRVVYSETAFPAGSIVRLSRGSSGLCQLYYRVASCLLSGIEYAITLSRPVKREFLEGDMIQSAQEIPTDIRIDGNGMLISGTGDRYLEIAAGLRCHVSDVRIDPSHGWLGTGGPAMSFDIGGYACSFKGCMVNSTGHPINAGCLIESGEACWIRDCIAEDAGVTGFGIYDSVTSGILDCKATGCIYGAYIGAGNHGSVECQVKGGAYWCNQQGILCGNSKRSIISGVTCTRNSEWGIKIATAEQGSLVADNTGTGNGFGFATAQPDCEVTFNNVRS